MSKRQIFRFIAVAMLLLTASLLLISSWVDPRDLTQPLSVASTRALADGGSMEVTMRGANGKILAIAREGSLKVERSRQQMYFVNCIAGVFQFRRSVERSEPAAKEARELLESWLGDKLTSEQRSNILINDPAALKNIPLNVVIVFDLAHWINEVN